jgi:hypothetical protein
MRSAGFDCVSCTAHAFAAVAWDTERFGTSLVDLIADFAPGRKGVNEAEARAWAVEQRQLGERGEFYFSYTQFCFVGVRGG